MTDFQSSFYAQAREKASPSRSWKDRNENGWRTALGTLEAAEQNAKSKGALEGLALCLLEKAELLLDAGQVEEALGAALEAQGLVIWHSELPVYLQIVVRVRLARLYGQQMDSAQVSSRLLLLANQLLMRHYQESLFALAAKSQGQSERAVELLSWQEASASAQQTLEALRQLPEDREYGGHPLSFWRARFKLQPLWIRVAEQVALGQDSDMAREIDEAYWTTLQDPDIETWNSAPELAFHFEYVGTWLGYEVLRPDASRFEGWEKQLWWSALRRPRGQQPVVLPLGLCLEEPPASARELPLIQILMQRASERLEEGGAHDRTQ